MGIIQEEKIFLNQSLATQKDVFDFLAEQAKKLAISTEENQVYQKLVERENEGTTGMMDGFAIPHAKDQSISQPSIIIVTLEHGIEWNSLDGQLIDFVIALFIPDSEAGTTHLKLLSAVARLLMRNEVTEQLKAAQSKTEIATLLNEKIGENE
ncbi:MULTISPECIES: fructose PTS transporter subunit IIA [Enterococcus]|uniref:PTS sugar transporter subunit IIA n=1 Tax=Candidatus Enterococcus murrayae TaxID=2815321 RepID=A0ABS3HNG0_9ENTE|nr:fructose PTS transporter subunit IIA [Enterococcus sp. MJM16]MBO0455004.1 PTS sugar transporter subunit IIA [Enterococcus sp. MJM16]